MSDRPQPAPSHPVRPRTMRRAALLMTALSLPLSGCAPLMYGSLTRPHDKRTFQVIAPALPASPVPGARLFQGSYAGIQGPAGYAAEVPANWNGTLIMYTHGYAGDGPELRVQAPPLRDYWLSQGYAWAASSYSANYYDVRAAVEDTNALALAFPALTGQKKPDKYLIVGFSMGGHAAAAAVEKETLQTARSRVNYAAAMPLCGVMDEEYEFQWLGNYTLLASQVAGFPVTGYPDANFRKNFPAIRAALFSSSDGALWAPNAAGTRLRDLARDLTGGARPVYELGFSVGALQQAVFSTGGLGGDINGILPGNLYTNQGLTYRWGGSSADEAALNAAIPRVLADPNANPPRWDGVRWLPRVNGEIGVPVLTMHTLGDFYVPFRHQQLYRQAVTAAGNADRLVQRAIRAPGHCDFNAAELVEAFNTLVAWEKTGVKPAGDDVLTASVVADPAYGCRFTRGDRPGVAACPVPTGK